MAEASPLYICPECRTGKMTPRHTAYHLMLGDHVITLPYFGVWVCDVCGHFQYDENSLTWLNNLVRSQAAQSSRRSRKLLRRRQSRKY